MATYSITAVHLVPGPGWTSHPHIGAVKLLDGSVVRRAWVIERIRAGDRFFTHARPPAFVYVHACPYCAASDYITTHPDNTPTNNLLSLPRF